MKDLIDDVRIGGLGQIFIGNHITITVMRDYFKVGFTIEHCCALDLHIGFITIELY